MVFQPSTEEEIFVSLKDRVKQRTDGISGFQEGGINYSLLRAYAQYWRIYEHGLLATQLSGWVDYAGGPVDDEGLKKLRLDVSKINNNLLNYFMNDQDLDALGVQNGITRGQGSRSIGKVLFTLNDADDAVIPEGTLVTTDGTNFREPLTFQTVREATPDDSGVSVLEVEIEAVQIGDVYNVGSGTIINMPQTPNGVESVTNPDGTSGGEGVESNEDYRERIKSALGRNSFGGTSLGIIGGLENEFEDIDSGDVKIVEDDSLVIVDGGNTFQVQEAIERLRPVGINLTMERPEIYTVDVECSVSGTSVDPSKVADAINDEIADNEIGEDVEIYDLFVAISKREPDVDNAEITLSSSQTGDVGGNLIIPPTAKSAPGVINVTIS